MGSIINRVDVLQVESSAIRSMRNHTVEEAVVDVHPAMGLLLLLLDLGIISEIPEAYAIAGFAYRNGHVRRR